MKNWQKWLLTIGGTILLVVVIPIAINECYKADAVYYVTIWDAADVLSYYGTVLGAVAAVTALVATIAYYRKQVVYEKMIQHEQEKWLRIEKLVDQALDDMHPSKITIAITEVLESQRMELIYLKLNTYDMTVKNTVDKLLLLTSKHKNEKLIDLSGKIDIAMKEFSKIVKGYMDFLLEISGKNLTLQMMKRGESTPELTQMCILQFMSDIRERSTEISKELSNTYETTYRPLITLKESVFDEINQQVLEDAKKILFFKQSAQISSAK